MLGNNREMRRVPLLLRKRLHAMHNLQRRPIRSLLALPSQYDAQRMNVSVILLSSLTFARTAQNERLNRLSEG